MFWRESVEGSGLKQQQQQQKAQVCFYVAANIVRDCNVYGVQCGAPV